MLPLTPPQANEVHVFYLFPQEARAQSLLQPFEKILSSDEIERRNRYVPERSRTEYLLGRGMIRSVLSAYSGKRPEEWIFQLGSHGRPEVVNWDEPTSIHFNLSHSHEVVICAFSRIYEVGIDVEYQCRRTNYLEVGRHVFSSKEWLDMSQLPAEQQRGRFFQFWTLKEAYIKARGMGLSIPLKEFAFELAQPITIEFSDQILDEASQWQFHFLDIKADHPVALATKIPSSKTVLIRQFNFEE